LNLEKRRNTLKKLLISILLLWAGAINATTAFEPYVVRSGQRSAEETVRQLESSSHLWEFQKELQTNTPFHFGHLTKAVEDGELVSRRCGDCSLETAGLRNGKTLYHRNVRPEEVVAYLNGVPLFLPACGNPVRPLHKEEVAPPRPEPIAPPPPQPSPAIPPPQARKEPPRSEEGCSPDQVTYTTEVYDLPSFNIGYSYGWNWQFFDPGTIVQTTSHHHWTCVHEVESQSEMEE
jgi:hypothetical protein